MTRDSLWFQVDDTISFQSRFATYSFLVVISMVSGAATVQQFVNPSDRISGFRSKIAAVLLFKIFTRCFYAKIFTTRCCKSCYTVLCHRQRAVAATVPERMSETWYQRRPRWKDASQMEVFRRRQCRNLTGMPSSLE